MLHAASIFLSSFLLFQVQLILGKFLLPWFGGTPSVWTTCMLFFQSMLLVGYGYAYLLDRFCSPRRQSITHAVVILLAAASLLIAFQVNGSPILPNLANKPESRNCSPILSIISLLIMAIGLPFLILAANSPLIQRWYSYENQGQPYRLYALSNVGSLLGLLSYPFLIEPTIGLQSQSIIWAGLFLTFCIVMACCASRLKKTTSASLLDPPSAGTGNPLSPGFTLLLSACPACLLLAITNDLCQEVAVVPFLWVLPLSIYLLSFIVCFDRPAWYQRQIWIPIAYFTTIVVLITSLKGIHLGLLPHVLSYSAFLFSICMVSHGELYRLRPEARKLTAFYLLIATGGVLGSMVVAVVAPLYFNGYWEFTLAALVTWAGLAWLYWNDKSTFLHTGNHWHFRLFIFLLSYVAIHIDAVGSRLHQHALIADHEALFNLGAAFVFTAAISLFCRKRRFTSNPIWPRLLLASVILIIECFAIFDVRRTSADTLMSERNFYGTLRVVEGQIPSKTPIKFRKMIHGNILHGAQSLRADVELEPTTYYNWSSGIGQSVANHPRRIAGQPLRVGVTGLGVGAISALLADGDNGLFFEINPQVIDLAYGPQATFSYLNKSPAQIDVFPGDARITLEQLHSTQGSQELDILALDAFTSDAIPTHLLTKEAFEVYLSHLRDRDSIIAVNISNRFLTLEDPVFNLAKHYDFDARIIFSLGQGIHSAASKWVVLTRNPHFFDQLRDMPNSYHEPYTTESDLIWTDDYSNLLRVIK